MAEEISTMNGFVNRVCKFRANFAIFFQKSRESLERIQNQKFSIKYEKKFLIVKKNYLRPKLFFFSKIEKFKLFFTN